MREVRPMAPGGGRINLTPEFEFAILARSSRRTWIGVIVDMDEETDAVFDESDDKGSASMLLPESEW